MPKIPKEFWHVCKEVFTHKSTACQMIFKFIKNLLAELAAYLYDLVGLVLLQVRALFREQHVDLFLGARKDAHYHRDVTRPEDCDF